LKFDFFEHVKVIARRNSPKGGRLS